MNKIGLLHLCPNAGIIEACGTNLKHGCRHKDPHIPRVITVNPDGSDGTDCQLRCGDNKDLENFERCKPIKTYDPDLVEIKAYEQKL